VRLTPFFFFSWRGDIFFLFIPYLLPFNRTPFRVAGWGGVSFVPQLSRTTPILPPLPISCDGKLFQNCLPHFGRMSRYYPDTSPLPSPRRNSPKKFTAEEIEGDLSILRPARGPTCDIIVLKRISGIPPFFPPVLSRPTYQIHIQPIALTESVEIRTMIGLSPVPAPTSSPPFLTFSCHARHFTRPFLLLSFLSPPEKQLQLNPHSIFQFPRPLFAGFPPLSSLNFMTAPPPSSPPLAPEWLLPPQDTAQRPPPSPSSFNSFATSSMFQRPAHEINGQGDVFPLFSFGIAH